MRGADGYVSSGKRGYSGQEGLLFLGCIPAPSVFRRRLPSPVDVHRCQGLSGGPQPARSRVTTLHHVSLLER